MPVLRRQFGAHSGVAGLVVDTAGYAAAFVFLAGCAIVALVTFWFGVPETRDWQGELSDA